MSNEPSYKKHTLRHYPKSDQHPNWDGKYIPKKPRPYDDAEYWWAYSYDMLNWYVIFKGECRKELQGTFEEIVDLLEEINKNIKPKIYHW